uniref:Transposase n=1 Tax=Cacopsylla melanoneura TaxID=428564 RepID=A0A8D8XBS9_9HEMI
MSDEAHFHLSGYVNKQNCRFWGTENPRICHEEPLHSLKVTVWCGVYAGKLISPYFFQDDVGNTVNVNRAMVNEFLLPQLDELGLENMWFQQDGATTHTAIDLLKQAFPGRLISRFGDIHFSARSPDLTVLDFFLRGFLKSRVSVNRPQTLDALKENICQEGENLSVDVLKKVMENALKSAQHCIDAGGGHLLDIIFAN